MSTDPYVKLHFSYYDDVVLATLGDDAEVMFTRGLSYCGRASSHGFIPAAKLLGLCRKSTQAQALKVASRLCGSVGEHEGPWVKVAGGYQVRNWERYQHELMTLQAKRKTDADRQRRKRETDRMSRATSRDMSRDSPTDVTHPSKSESKDPAAAASAAAGSGDALPGDVEILRSKLAAYTALANLRFDISAANIAELQALIRIHGDDRLVAVAVKTCKSTPPTYVSGFLGTWRTMPVAGVSVAAVSEPVCRCGKTRRAHDAAEKLVPLSDRHDFEVAA